MPRQKFDQEGLHLLQRAGARFTFERVGLLTRDGINRNKLPDAARQLNNLRESGYWIDSRGVRRLLYKAVEKVAEQQRGKK